MLIRRKAYALILLLTLGLAVWLIAASLWRSAPPPAAIGALPEAS